MTVFVYKILILIFRLAGKRENFIQQCIFPVTAIVAESPVSIEFSGETPSMAEKVNYPWAVPGEEGRDRSTECHNEL